MYYTQKLCWVFSSCLGLVIAQDGSASGANSGDGAVGQGTMDPIKSCVDVDCPIGDGSDTYCQVGNMSFADAGVVEISNKAFSTDLTWTLDFQVNDYPVGLGVEGRQFSRSFYFGSPPSINTTLQGFSYVGCAFFITNVEAYHEE